MSLKNDLPLYKCPRYSKCSVNNCPLHPAYPDLPVDEGDTEQKCNMEKNVRLRISAEFPGVLKFDGMTPREFTGAKKWAELPPEEKERRQEKARLNLFSYRSSGGKKNIPPRNPYDSQPNQNKVSI